jgi:uncharacterized protein YegP (UPF0339 family)
MLEELMAGTFEIYQDARGGYRFRLKSRQGWVLATGQSFPTKQDAKRGIATVLMAAAGAQIEDTTTTARRGLRAEG